MCSVNSDLSSLHLVSCCSSTRYVQIHHNLLNVHVPSWDWTRSTVWVRPEAFLSFLQEMSPHAAEMSSQWWYGTEMCPQHHRHSWTHTQVWADRCINSGGSANISFVSSTESRCQYLSHQRFVFTPFKIFMFRLKQQILEVWAVGAAVTRPPRRARRRTNWVKQPT